MECKFHTNSIVFSWIIELIDTLWNVNQSTCQLTFYKYSELIDTLWNVNKLGKSSQNSLKRINRYIMECKLI